MSNDLRWLMRVPKELISQRFNHAHVSDMSIFIFLSAISRLYDQFWSLWMWHWCYCRELPPSKPRVPIAITLPRITIHHGKILRQMCAQRNFGFLLLYTAVVSWDPPLTVVIVVYVGTKVCAAWSLQCAQRGKETCF